MFKPSLGLGTQLGAAANKPDLNVGHTHTAQLLGGFPNEIKTKIRHLIICCYHNLIL